MQETSILSLSLCSSFRTRKFRARSNLNFHGQQAQTHLLIHNVAASSVTLFRRNITSQLPDSTIALLQNFFTKPSEAKHRDGSVAPSCLSTRLLPQHRRPQHAGAERSRSIRENGQCGPRKHSASSSLLTGNLGPKSYRSTSARRWILSLNSRGFRRVCTGINTGLAEKAVRKFKEAGNNRVREG